MKNFEGEQNESRKSTSILERKYFYDHAFYGNQKTKITLATLGNDAGIYGAAKQVL